MSRQCRLLTFRPMWPMPLGVGRFIHASGRITFSSTFTFQCLQGQVTRVVKAHAVLAAHTIPAHRPVLSLHRHFAGRGGNRNRRKQRPHRRLWSNAGQAQSLCHMTTPLSSRVDVCPCGALQPVEWLTYLFCCSCHLYFPYPLGLCSYHLRAY